MAGACQHAYKYPRLLLLRPLPTAAATAARGRARGQRCLPALQEQGQCLARSLVQAQMPVHNMSMILFIPAAYSGSDRYVARGALLQHEAVSS
eukprot:CAMPEP_0202878230 /NCGR_PEP_ID=MMETSP1391-20130828/31879_1 /ASSEMBLY_ACC=CAM_ASM_000867 /TAXON_ID=1034604 /ORGANISM="Chlamydomonas leiostraca, Strain SAG 11-49" /LENGTH=92 /DNA_ID=CAMNT_0049560391 /DNA_START=149 /DNA_END=427 /DNA_ORIENTATION=-